MSRRRILVVRFKPRGDAASFIFRQMDEWVEALSLHADLTLIEDDFDFAQVCNAVQPDFVVFEARRQCRMDPPVITNLSSHRQIPRVGFDPSDCFAPARTLTYRLFQQAGVERVFLTGFGHLQQTPELAGRAYCLPEMIDLDEFRDFGQTKSIPVNIFGGVWSPNLYSWRARAVQALTGKLPILIYEHPGYGKGATHPFAVSGEAYARLLNQSHFCLVDSTRFDFLVRKHLEVPACGSILVAPDSAGLRLRGFIDGVNCILGKPEELAAKIKAVYADATLMETIRRNGRELVQSRFDNKHWRGMLDWYDCFRSLRPGEVVQQQGLLGPFAAVPDRPGLPAIGGFLPPDNEFSAILKAACRMILDGGNLAEAETQLAEIANWGPVVREVWLPLALIALLRGDAERARQLLLGPHGFLQNRDGISILDPAELAWLMAVATMLRQPQQVAEIAAEAVGVPHLSLRRMQWMLAAIQGAPPEAPDGLMNRLPGDRLSTHWLGQLDFGNWTNLIGRIFAANGFTTLFGP